MYPILLTLLASSQLSAGPAEARPPRGEVVVANRGAGSISVIEVATDTVTQTIDLPMAVAQPEPMYVEPAGGLLFVGDRANDRVVAYDPETWGLVGTLPTGAGVFHMKADLRDEILWVVCDVDKTVSVISATSFQNVATIPIPADLVSAGGKPHDVVVDFRSAYVTVNGVDGSQAYVVRFSRNTLQEIDRFAVGDDAHLGIDVRNRSLLVPSQDGNAVYVLRRFRFHPTGELAVPGAHGAWFARAGNVFYTTNLPGGGTDGLVTIDARHDVVLGTTDTPYPVPHNIAVDSSGAKVYVSHSGATADKVTVYATTHTDPVPTLIGEITVGTNPFGVTYLP